MDFKRTIIIAFAFLLTACSTVKVSTVDSAQYMQQRRGDVISSGRLSQQTISALNVLGFTENECAADLKVCLETVKNTNALNDERHLSSLSELWLFYAMSMDDNISENAAVGGRRKLRYERLNGFFESARHAYAYLFFTHRSLDVRALEDRQNQVRDFYNYATQRAISIVSNLVNKKKIGEKRNSIIGKFGGWNLNLDVSGMLVPEKKTVVATAFIDDSQLSFEGLRNQYVKDGLGARMVVTLTDLAKKPKKDAWEMMRYIAVTALLKFPGENLSEILSSKDATIFAYDTYRERKVKIGEKKVPLAANYSAAYGLWLANSDFATQSIGTIFGKGDILEEPRVYLMQPYRADLKTVILVHGLASSPEAWVNAANEIMGDEELHKHYQIWQVYYPTSVSIPVNRYEIYSAIEKTFNHYDPERKNPASRDAVLIGHSMGGIISRVMVSTSDKSMWNSIVEKYPELSDYEKEMEENFGQYMFFQPLPEVSRAVFIAAPHRGTPIADKTIVRYIASAVKLPVSILKKTGGAAFMILGNDKLIKASHSMNGIDNLGSKDPTIQLLNELKISPIVKYHSIIANDTPDETLENSSDGLVPYSSSHLDGAVSEKVIKSGHSVQETPEAIIEIRRILREHLNEIREK